MNTPLVWTRLSLAALLGIMAVGLGGCGAPEADTGSAPAMVEGPLEEDMHRYPYPAVGSIATTEEYAYIVVGESGGILDRVVREPLDGSASEVVYRSTHEAPYIVDIAVLDDERLVIDDRTDGGGSPRITVLDLTTDAATVINADLPPETYVGSVVVAGGRVYWHETDASDPLTTRTTIMEWDPATSKTRHVTDAGANVPPMAGTDRYLYYVQLADDGGTADLMRLDVAADIVDAVQGVEGSSWWLDGGGSGDVIMSSNDPVFDGDEVIDVIGDDGSITHALLDVGSSAVLFDTAGQRLGALSTETLPTGEESWYWRLFTLDLVNQTVAFHPLERDGSALSADAYYFIDEETAIVFARTPDIDPDDPATGMFRYVIDLGPIGSVG